MFPCVGKFLGFLGGFIGWFLSIICLMGEKITLRFLWVFYKNTEMSKKHCIKPGHYDILYKGKVCYRMYMKIVNRGVSMATRSILKNIVVKDRKFCHSLISALEHSKDQKGKEVKLTRQVRNLDKDDIIKIFGDKNDRLS